ncbi:MAG: serine/threonine-protein phosphatase [Myxococcaceae bacterium]|jgi:serine/threonine protein phosphatase PrpC|nr:MAG: serine/threonine-protein phosphatase [Myxococcaceae bacterium]
MPRYTSFGQSDVGRVRKHNEDAFIIDDSLGLYVVADGLGGHAAGEVASEEAVYNIRGWVRRERPKVESLITDPYDVDQQNVAEQILRGAIQAATYLIHSMAEFDETKAGMGTTTSVLMLLGRVAVIGQVGDSRIYLARDGQIAQITDDHTLIAAQIREGMLTPEEARYAPHRNVITRAVGSHEYVEVDTRVVETIPGDRFLLCSDGLHGYVEEPDEILPILSLPVEQVTQRLIDIANTRGGKDNITAIVVEVHEV